MADGKKAITGMLDTLAEQVKRDQVKLFEATMAEATKEAGTNVDGGGKPISAEKIIEAYEKMEFSFDEDGNWDMPTLMMHPSQAARTRAELMRIDTDPTLNARMNAVVTKKRDAWRVREANRTLVD